MVGPPKSKQCEVCRTAQSKYKCHSCLLPYCSLVYFKTHKEVPCQKLLLPEEQQVPLVLPEISFQVDEQDWILHATDFQSIVESSEIRDALKDDHLRKLIYAIDCSKDPEGELDKVMEAQEFRQFTDKILSVVSPQR